MDLLQSYVTFYPSYFIYYLTNIVKKQWLHCSQLWCDQAKSVWSRLNSVFSFLTNCMHHFFSYILQKTPLKLINSFQRYEQLKDAKNNRKQKKFSALFGSILESIFPTSDWFCLITSQLMNVILTLNPSSPKGVPTTPQTVFALVLKIAQPRGKIAPNTFKFIPFLHFSETKSNLPPTPR